MTVADPAITEVLEPDVGPGRTICGDPIRRFVAVAVGLFVLAAALVLTSVHRAPQLSPFDEWTHADYAYQVAHGHIPARGGVISAEILQEFSCHGLQTRRTLPPCGEKNPPPTGYPTAGENYNFGHPPLYYAITGVLARLGNAIDPGPHFITFARSVGTLWLFAAMIVLYVAARRFGATWPFALTAAACLPLCPLVLHATSTVNNDAAAPLCGALALWILARILVGGRTGWIVPAVVTAACTATKVLNALPLLIVVAALLVAVVLRWRNGNRAGAKQFLVIALAMVVAFFVVYKGWALFQSGRGVAHWVNPVAHVSSRPIHGQPFNELFSTSFTGLSFVSSFYLPVQLNGETLLIWNRLLAALATAAPFMALFAFRTRTPQWIVGATALLGVAVYPLIVELQVYIESGDYFPSVVSRYGISLVPLLLIAAGLAASYRRWLRPVLAIGAIGVLLTLLAVTGVS